MKDRRWTYLFGGDARWLSRGVGYISRYRFRLDITSRMVLIWINDFGRTKEEHSLYGASVMWGPKGVRFGWAFGRVPEGAGFQHWFTIIPPFWAPAR